MKLLVATVVVMALMAIPAGAQGRQPPWQQLPTKDEKGDHTPDDNHAIKADDKAYRSALDGIPQIKGSDPWRSMRETPKSNSAREAAKSKSPR